MPDIEGGEYLVDILFRVGPVLSEAPLSEAELEPWERRRGIELHPWQADLVIDLSKAYFQQMHEARSPSALAPWPKARNMWKYVMDQQNAASLRASLAETKGKARDGNRQ